MAIQAEADPATMWSKCEDYVSVGEVKVHTSVTDYFLQLPNFPSLPHPPSKCYLPAKGHGPVYIVSSHDQNFDARVLCPLSSCKSAQLHVMQQHRDFQLLFLLFTKSEKEKRKNAHKTRARLYEEVNWKPAAGSVWDLTWSSVWGCSLGTPYVVTVLFSSP